jgi:hypothetical protein
LNFYIGLDLCDPECKYEPSSFVIKSILLIHCIGQGISGVSAELRALHAELGLNIPKDVLGGHA